MRSWRAPFDSCRDPRGSHLTTLVVPCDWAGGGQTSLNLMGHGGRCETSLNCVLFRGGPISTHSWRPRSGLSLSLSHALSLSFSLLSLVSRVWTALAQLTCFGPYACRVWVAPLVFPAATLALPLRSHAMRTCTLHAQTFASAAVLGVKLRGTARIECTPRRRRTPRRPSRPETARR